MWYTYQLAEPGIISRPAAYDTTKHAQRLWYSILKKYPSEIRRVSFLST
ncbi:hypothetical protein HMPREF1141_0182 [Clostridium sp. MSTE9]|nr:hypothetical protein HMPREF1141_0182 [Clostridium sp. MSTE9]